MPKPFMFATGIENSYPTIEWQGKTIRRDEMIECGHMERWKEDFQLVKEVGLEYLRYGPPLYKTHLGSDKFDWEFTDETFAELKRLGITPIADLCHFGVPDWIGGFDNPEWPKLFATYAKTFAERYPWVRLYTPVNEIFVSATFSGLLGWWNERQTTDRGFVTALHHLCKANILAMRAILEVQPLARFIQSESSEYFHVDEPRAMERAAFFNQRRFLSLDLSYGQVSSRLGLLRPRAAWVVRSPPNRESGSLGRGIVTEVYHPWVDHAAIRDLQFIVTSPDGFFSEEKTDCAYQTSMIEPGIPAYRLTNECCQKRYQIRKDIIADPKRDVLLQRIQFKPVRGNLADYRLFVLMSPRLGDQGKNNSAWVGSFHSHQLLFAERESHALALGCSAPWLRRSVGYVGTSDAWQDLKRHGQLTWDYNLATQGHVALAGEIDLRSCNGEFILSMGLDRSPGAAALNASLSLVGRFDEARDLYVEQWRNWHKATTPLSDGKWTKLVSANAEQRSHPDSSRPRIGVATQASASIATDLYRVSMMVLRVHRSKQFAGASVASLAVPWGEARGDDDRGGYHLVWPRDLVEESGGFLAGGALDEARCALNYLRVTQKPDGGWTQMMWLDGTPYSEGVQLDESSLPILLVALAHREKALSDEEAKSFWPMVRDAAGYVIRNGPSTGQSRWENSSGLSPYTLATEVAALVAAATLAERCGERDLADYFRETADIWNDSIEAWTYAVETPLAKRIGVDGYYVRLAPSPGLETIRERSEHPTLGTSRDLPYSEVISPDALALVRFGLRRADDPRILNTLKAIDSINRTDTPAGPCWRRYNGGFYGETDAGEPFTGQHVSENHGRAWPLLTGERGHYEIAAANTPAAETMLTTMAGLCSEIGLLPEQVWDQADIPNHHLFFGRPAGSAMPLAWTHSEYVRLLRSLHDGRVFDLPAEAHERYVKRSTKSDLALWRFDHQSDSFLLGRRLRIEVHAPAVIHYTLDNWQTARDLHTRATGIGLHLADLPTEKVAAGERVCFTFCWSEDGNRWEGRNFCLSAKSGLMA